MKKIRIWFCDFWPNFDVNNNFIINVLEKNYDVELDKKNPEYIFYSNFGYEFLRYEGIKIFYSGENVFPNLNICDYSITCHDIEVKNRHFCLPVYMVKNGRFIKSSERKRLTVKDLEHKDRFCNFIYDNKKGDSFRKNFFEELSKYKKVDSAGKFLNNMGFVTKNKMDMQKYYRFTIAFENEKYEDYCTEKIMDAFISRTIPIYWGDCNIDKIINPKAFINCNKGFNNILEIIYKIKKIEENKNLWLEMVNEPIFLKENFVEKKKNELKKFLCNIINSKEKKNPNSLEAKRVRKIVKMGCKFTYLKHKLHKIKVEKWK